jgi:hypothetical protein
MIPPRRRSGSTTLRLVVLCFMALVFVAVYLSWGHKAMSVMSRPALFKLRMLGISRNPTHESDSTDEAGTWGNGSDGSGNSSFADQIPEQIDSFSFIKENMRSRAFERLIHPGAPWENKPIKSTVLGYPNKDTLGCNPMSLSCGCLKEWYGRDVCLEAAHRQKQPIKLIFKKDAWWMPNDLDIGDHDCPTTQCMLSLGGNHDKDADAFISPLKPGRFFPSISFPPKQDKAKNLNIMLNFESSIKYKMLLDPFYYRQHDIDVYGSHTGWPVPKDLLNNGSLSFVELSDLDRPASIFRKHGPSFAERSDHVALFVSHCVGTRLRTKILAEIAKHITIYSFGSCTPPLAKRAKVADVYPQCANLSTVGKMAEKECVLAYSKFSLSIENVQEHNYVTEKLYQALAMGAIPIYWGAPNANDIIPRNGSALVFFDMDEITNVMQKAKQISANESLWNEYTQWKDARFSDGFLGLIRNQRGSMFCRLCEHIADKTSRTSLTSVRLRLSQCTAAALNRLTRKPSYKGIPLGDPHSWTGLDAVAILKLSSSSEGDVDAENQDNHAKTQLGIDPWYPGDTVTDEDVECVADSMDRSGVLSLGDLQGNERLTAAAQVLLTLYTIAMEGRQNTLVTCTSTKHVIPLMSRNKESWHGLLTRVPADYDIVIISADSAEALQGKPHWHVTKLKETKVDVCGGWLVSQQGARKLLLRGGQGKAVNVYAVGDKKSR